MQARKLKPASQHFALDQTARTELRIILGVLKRKGRKSGDREKAYRYRVQLQKSLLKVRSASLGSSPTAFFSVLDQLTRLEASLLARQPVGHDYLLQLLSAEALPIERELAWISARIKHERAVIHRHLELAREIETVVLNERHKMALEQLAEYEAELGVSLWSTELKIALTQDHLGTEAQKALLKVIRGVRRVGMWPFVANTASTKAETTVSISWFLSETMRRHKRFKRNEFSEYATYRSLGEWPESSAAAARVLRTEQCHHIIDVYETFVSYLQHAIVGKPNDAMQSTIAKCLTNLADLPDFRIRKMEFLTQGAVSKTLNVAPLDIFDELLHSQPEPASKLSLFRIARKSLSAESTVALALSTKRTTLIRKNSSAKNVAVRGLAEALLRRGHQAEMEGRASEQSRKWFHSYHMLAYAKSLRSMFGAVTESDTRAAIREMRLAALNSERWGFLDLVSFGNNPHYANLRELFPKSIGRDFTDAMSGSAVSEIPTLLLREDAASLGRAISLLIRSRPDAAAASIGAALSSEDRIISTQAGTVALNAYAYTGDAEQASNLITRLHVNFGVNPEAMPVRKVFEGLEWEQLELASSGPELSIALSLIQSTEGDDKLKTYRRFALETLLMTFNISKPSELRDVNTGWAQPILTYLLEQVCTPAMLDMLPAIRSTRDVLVERREICGYLAILDKENSERHRLEVLEISRDLTVLDGLRTIDGSRVHVDKESLARRLRVELAESFQRYTALVRSASGQADRFSTVLKDINLADRAPDYLYEMPVSESDELLVSMLLRCKEQFLFNTPHGLDSYVSKRIRHGSIVGVVRAPAEREGIVAKRNLDGTYRPGGTWAEHVQDTSQRAALAVAINATSKSIDQYLIRLKDTLLHVKSADKPHGMLDAPLAPAAYLLIRSVANEESNFDGFVETMFNGLWGLLGPSLLNVNALLTKESIPFVSDQIRSLRVKAQKILSDPQERAAFDAAAGKASVGMQASLSSAASWFEPAASKARVYSLSDVVDIAMASVRATNVNFLPVLHLEGNAEFSFSELALPFLCDVFYIAFGNIASHGSSEENAKIWVQVDQDAQNSFLDFRIENALPEMQQEEREELKSNLAHLRSEIAKCNGVTRVRLEGGSGLHKLASMVTQSEGGTLDFNLTEQGFEVFARLKYAPGEVS